MLRILTLSTLYPNGNRPTFGGFVERQTLALAARRDAAVEVVSPRGIPLWPLSLHRHYAGTARLPRQQLCNGLVVHRPPFRVWPGVGAGGNARSLARTLLPFLTALRARFPFDVIDAEFFWPDGVAAVAVGRALGVPVSIKARGSDIGYWSKRPKVRAQLLSAAAAADGLLAVSEALRREMDAIGIDPGRVRVHYTGVDQAIFRPIDRTAAKAALGVEGPLIVTAGNLVPGKGQRIAIEAVARIPGATLLLVGDGPERKPLQALVRAQGLDARVRFLGARPHAAMPALLGAADLMMLPTRSEGLANAWVEALACGTPVVTPDVGGAAEVIDRPEAGRLVPAEPQAMAAAAADILRAPPDPEAVRAAAARFSWEENSRQLFDHLCGLARRSP